MTETILTILTILLGGCNIWQLVFIRLERKKAVAQADDAITDSRRNKYELSKDQADYLIENLSRVQKEYMELQENVRAQAAKYTEEILGKCNMIADLKSQVIYLKGLRCYKSDCSMRIAVNVKDNNHKEENNENEQSGDSQIKGI